MKKRVIVWETLPTISGGQKMTLNIMDMLSDQYDFCCLLPSEGILSEELSKRNIPWFAIGSQTLPTGIKGKRVFFRYGWMSIKNIYNSLKKIKIYKPDILYCPGPAALPWSAVCGCMTHIPVIWHLHHIFLDTTTIKLLNMCGAWKSIKRIIAVSNCVGNQIKNTKAQKKVAVTYNPVDLKRYANGRPELILSEIEEALGRKIKKDKTIVLTHIGAITKNKCQDKFVKTVFELKKRGKDVIGLLIGDVITQLDYKYKASVLKYIIDNKLDKDIYIPGFRQDIADVLSVTDCVVIPSSEGFPLVALEAMCAKTHVVAMNQGGSSEALKAAGCGETYPFDGDEKEIADAVLKALNESVGKIEKGYHFCEQQSFEKYRASLLKLFGSLH